MKYTYMPINVSIKDRRCLVVGGGPVALRKVEKLLDYDTHVTVVAPDVHEKLEYHAEHKRITLEKREYKSPEASEYGLVISASNDSAVNRQVSEDAKSAGVLVNVVDVPEHSDFIVPAVFRRDCLTTAISTDGKAPFLAAHLRLILENIFPKHWNRIVRLASDFRKKVNKRWGDDTNERFASLDRFLSADWKTLIKNKNEAELENELDKLLEPSEDEGPPTKKDNEEDQDGAITMEFGGDK